MIISLKTKLYKNRHVILFCLGFCCFLCIFSATFYANRVSFATYYIRPMVYIASFLLHLIAIENQVSLAGLARGFCDLELNQIAYRVKHECTGLFASSIFSAAVLAYPASIKKKLLGIFMGASAFFVFGTLRIIIMAFVAVISPEHIHFFHVYVMVIASLGFSVILWILWLE